MRPKIVLAILVPALAIVGAIIFLKPHQPASAPDVSPAPAASITPAPTPVPELAPAPAPAPVVVKKTPTPEEREAAIDAETKRLSDWAMNDDPQSLSNILNDLNSPEKEVRMAAVDAAEQFESTNAIPALRAAAAKATDSEEAMAMLQAADWLALPTVTWGKGNPNAPLTPEQLQAIERSKAAAAARRREFLQIRAARIAAHSDSQSQPAPPPANGQNPPTTPNNQ